MLTPLRGRDELDVEGLEKLVEHIVAGGVSGLFLCGTTGEGPSLSYRLRLELVKRTCQIAKGRVHIIVAITDTSFVESVNLAQRVAEVGANSLVVAPPFYLPAGQPELVEYLDHLVPELPLPLYLYNMPSLTKVSFEMDLLRRATENPRIIGLKDSSGNMTYFHRALAIARLRPDWSVFIGPEELLPEAVLAGGSGGVNGGANLFPRLYVQLYQAARAGDLARTRQLHSQVMYISDRLYNIGRHPSSLIKGLKSALSSKGVCNDFMAEPFHRFRAEERSRVQKTLAEIEAKMNDLQLTAAA